MCCSLSALMAASLAIASSLIEPVGYVIVPPVILKFAQ